MTEYYELFSNAKTIGIDDFLRLLDALDSYSSAEAICLIERYPFLLPKNRFSGEVVFDYDTARREFIDYLKNDDLDAARKMDGDIYSELESMPDGWLKYFGVYLIEDINNLLLASSADDPYEHYFIEQIKEKFGSLRYYDTGLPLDVGDEMLDLVHVYEFISKHTCIVCGSIENVKMDVGGWISPYCSEHIGKVDYEDDYFDKNMQKSTSDIAILFKYPPFKKTGLSKPVPITIEDILCAVEEKIAPKPVYARGLVEKVIERINENRLWEKHQ